MAGEDVARAHHQAQQQLANAAAQVAGEAWRQVDPDNIVRSWGSLSPEVTVATAGAQRAIASQADGYLDEVLEAQGLPAAADGAVNPAAFAGVASDGRPLDSLIAQPANAATYALASGHSMPRALATGQASLDMMVRTQVMDASRTADQVALVAHRAVAGYVRLLTPPSCSRCAILAGRWYRYSAGFQRHPRCDCLHLPASEGLGRDLTTDPRAYFDSLTAAQQDRLFTKAGAQAIRDGADISQVVNARQGMYTAAGGRQFTRASTTRRGGVPGGPRLMPEEIYRVARSRDEVLELLRANSYLRATPRPTAAPSARTPRTAAPAQPATLPAARTAKAAQPVPATAREFHRNVDDIADLAVAVERGFPPRNSRPLTGGVSAETELVTLADGRQVVRKSGGNPDAEQLASLMGNRLGVRTPRVYRNHPSEVWMDYIDDAITAEELRSALPDEWDRRRRALSNTDDGALAGLLDVLIGNVDRNTGNWMLTGAGRVVAIDHGHAWGAVGRLRPRRPTINGPFAENYAGGPNPLTQADIAEVRRRLEELRPDFAQLGREAWLDYSLQVLDLLARNAGGISNVIA